MKKRFRLRRRADFQRVLAAGRVHSGRAVVGFATPTRAAQVGPRIGIAVSRRVQGAVARNRARRRLREAVRLELESRDSLRGSEGITYDVVLIARAPALEAALAELRREVRSALRRTLARVGPP